MYEYESQITGEVVEGLHRVIFVSIQEFFQFHFLNWKWKKIGKVVKK